MGILKDQSGYSLVEMLVCISLIGIILFISTIVYVRLFSNPKILLRSEALLLANEEIENTLYKKTFTDTSYTNEKASLTLEKHVTNMETYAQVEVLVTHGADKTEIVKLSFGVKK